MVRTSKDAAIARLRQQLRQINARRESLEAELKTLLAISPSEHRPLATADKIALFRRLFSGRPDVFALRWENRKDGRSGYAPACANEWIPGVCAKPKIKCSACPNQAFLPITDDAIIRHLKGPPESNGRDFTMGIYPLLQGDHCW